MHVNTQLCPIAILKILVDLAKFISGGPIRILLSSYQRFTKNPFALFAESLRSLRPF